MRVHAVPALIAGAALLVASAQAQTITVTSPSGTDKIASGGDFATEVIGDPWDMSQQTDVSAYVLDWQSWSISGGVFSGRTTNDPSKVASIYVQYQGEQGTNHHGREGVFFPIDAARYGRLAIRMYTDRPGNMRLLYFRKPGTLTDTTASRLVPISQGWNVYDIDLAALGGYCVPGSNCSSPTWSGTVLGLSIEPNNTNDANVIIDWIRLREGDNSSTTFPITWSHTDPTGNAVVDLYADDDTNPGNGFTQHIATGVAASAGQYGWPVNVLMPRPYWVYAVIGTTYAGNALRDPWDLSQASDVEFTGWQSGGVGGGVFSGVSASGSAALYPRINPRVSIRADAFHYFRIRMNVGQASKLRVFWRREGETSMHVSDYIDVTPGIKDYVIDLSQYSDYRGNIDLVRVNPTLGSNSVTVDHIELSSIAGDAATDSDYSDAPLTVNEVPLLHITDPDLSGGADFATTVLGNPWDMNDAADLPHTEGVTNESFSGGQYHATNSINDAAVYPFYGNGPDIDASKYHLFTVAFKIDKAFNVPVGSVSRIFWRPDQMPGTPQTATKSYIAYPDWVTLTTDLNSVDLENNPPYNLPIPWQGTERELRFDPHEFPVPAPFHIDYIKLAADDESNGLFDITWTDSDGDDNATIALYWDTDDTGFNGTLITQGIPENDPANSYTWNTASLPSGPLWVYATITDGFDSTSRYATGLMVNNPTDTTGPYLTLLRPDRGSSGASPNAPVLVTIRDVGTGVDTSSAEIRVNGALVSPQSSGNSSALWLSYTPASPWSFGQTVTVSLEVDDLAGNHSSDSYSFTVTGASDGDGDGLPDQFETASDLNPGVGTGTEGAAGNPDEDAAGNLAEYSSGDDPTSWAQIIAGPGPGSTNPPDIQLHYYEGTREPSFAKSAYAVSRFGVNVGAGAIESLTARTIISGPGPGDVFGPQIKAFRPDNTDVAKVNYYAYGTLKFGAHGQSGDIDGDGYDEILTSPGRGAVFGPHVRGWNFDGSAITAVQKINYFAYGTLKYGAHVRGAFLDGDGFSEMLTSPGPGTVFGPQVRGWNFDASSVTSIGAVNFLALPVTQYGAEIDPGDIDGDAFDEILAGPGPGPSFGAVLRGWNYDGNSISGIPGINSIVLSTSYGAVVAAGDIDGDRVAEPLAGAGPDPAGDSSIRAFDFAGGTLTSLPGSPFEAFPGQAYGVRISTARLGF